MRKISAFILFVLMAAFSTQAAFAAEPKSDASRELFATIDNVLDILKKPEFKDKATRDALLDQIETEVRKTFDFNEFCARTVGGHWKNFSEAQKKSFEDAFADLLYYTYVGSLEQYSGEKFIFVNEASNTKGDKVEIQTYFPHKGQNYPVNYRMLKKPEGWKVYDLIIENVSLVQNYRNQFQDILNKQGPDQLITVVQQKAKEKKDSNEASATK